MLLLGVSDIGFWVMVICGIGLFLYGITSISKVLKRLASKKLESAISKCSNNRILGFLTGAAFTCVVQSSSATSSLAIGLVRAGIMTLIQASAIIVGANIGTTITAFIVSIPLMDYLPLFIFIGSFILMLFTKKKWQNFGELFFAIGCIFFGLFIMDIYLKQLANETWFEDVLLFISTKPWLGLLIGAGLTAILQSSSAVIGVLQGIYAVSAGVMPLFGVLPIVFGSNIGTASTAVISSIGGSKESKRVALFHVIFNVTGALLFMGIMFIFKKYLMLPLGTGEPGTDTFVWSISPKVQIALCHLIFNGVTAIIFLPLLNVFCKLLTMIIKGGDTRSQSLKLKELDKSFLRAFPTQGILLAKDQVSSAFSYSKTMFETMNLYLDKHKDEDSSFIHEIEAAIDRIDRQLNEYLLSIEKGDLNEDDLILLTQTLKGCKDIERIGDYAENLITFFENMNERKATIPANYLQLFISSNNRAIDIIQDTIEVYTKNDKKLALKIIKDRRLYNEELNTYIDKHFENVSSKRGEIATYLDLVFVDIINCYQRVFSHCSNVAKLFNTDKVYVYTVEEQTHFSNMKNRY